MKTGYLISILLASFAICYGIWKFSNQTWAHREKPPVTGQVTPRNTQTVQLPLTNTNKDEGITNFKKGTFNSVNQVDEFYRAVTDPESGEYAIVDSSKSRVVLKDRNGTVIWSVDVVKMMDGFPIYSIQLSGDNLVVKAGRDRVWLNKKTGKIVTFSKSGPDPM